MIIKIKNVYKSRDFSAFSSVLVAARTVYFHVKCYFYLFHIQLCIGCSSCTLKVDGSEREHRQEISAVEISFPGRFAFFEISNSLICGNALGS